MKKGQATFEIILFLLKIAFTISVVLVVVSLTRAKINETIDIRETELFIANYGFLFNEEIMVIDEITDRIYPNMIDMNKFESKEFSDRLKKTFFYKGNQFLAAKITLQKNDDTLVEKYLNQGEQQGYQEWKVLADIKADGTGAATEKVFILPTLYSKDEINLGMLTLSIIQKK